MSCLAKRGFFPSIFNVLLLARACNKQVHAETLFSVIFRIEISGNSKLVLHSPGPDSPG